MTRKDEALKLALEALILKTGMNPVMQGSCYVMHPEALQAVIDEAVKQALAAPTVQEPVAHLWQHSQTGRTRVVMPGGIITADASWFVVGPLVLGDTPHPQHSGNGLG